MCLFFRVNNRDLGKRAMFILLGVMLILSTSMVNPVNVKADTKNFAANSLIIPMDTTYQNMGMWKAYGLVYNLLSNGIPVSWAINPNKTFSGTDFTATTQDLRTGTSIGSYNYSGGPFIIDSVYATQATTLIQAWWVKYANQPTVHKATAGFNANVDIVLKTAPRIANELINAGITIAYYNAAGIPDLNGNPWTNSSPNILDETEIANGSLFASGACSTRNFDIFVTPHNSGYSYSLTDPTNLGTKTYSQLDYFVQQGGGWMALCHSILSNENAIVNLYKYSSPSVRALFTSPVNGGFLTQNGFSSIANTGGTWTVATPGLPLAQAVTTPSATQTLPGGSVQDWARTSVSYYSQTEKVAYFNNAGTIYDWAINGVSHNGSGLGKLTFLGGHSYSTSLPYSSNYEAPYLRFFYNGLFFNGSAVAKLDLTTTPSAVPQGMTSTVLLKLSNTGSSIATNTNNVSIKLASGVNYISTNVGPLPTVTHNGDGTTTLDWGNALGNISGGTTPLVIQIQVNLATIGENKIAHLSAQYGDVYNEGFTADLCRALNVYPAPAPTISKTPASQTGVYPGAAVTWTLTYSNSGATSLLNSTVKDTLPAGFTFKSATPAPASVIPYTGNTTLITWHTGTLAANSSPQTITLTAYANGTAGSTYTNSVTLSGQDANNNAFSATSTATVTLTAPPIKLAKSVSPTGSQNPGQVLTYSLRPSFYGTDLLSDVLVSDPVPAYTTYVAGSVSTGGSYGYTPLTKVDGVDTVDPALATGTTTNSIMTTPPNAVVVGSTITVTMTLINNTNKPITNIVPTLDERLGAATVSAPSQTGFSLAASGGSTSVTFTCTMTDIGERAFIGNATGTVVTTDDYTFADATSNTVLVTSFLNASPANDLVTWRLGTNTAGVPGQTINSGFTAGVYGFRGAGTKEFSKYVITNANWVSKAAALANIKQGGALTVDASTHTIYASEGNNAKKFYGYSASGNTWTALADAPGNIGNGGAIQFLTVSGTKYVYVLAGASQNFYRYNISSNTWSTLASTPAKVDQGGALTTDGTYIYALGGNGTKNFWQYNIGTNTWTAKADTPANVKWGGALTRVGSYIYAFAGNNTTAFWRYDITGNSWSALAVAPGKVQAGGALTADGTNIYAFQGKTKAFWRYNIAANTWTALGNTNFGGNVDQGGALVYEAGINPQGYYTTMVSNASLVTTGDTITVTLTVESDTAVNNVSPSSVTVTATNGASATLSTGPTRTSADNNIANVNDPVTYQWTYTVTTGTINPIPPGSTLTFAASATGNGPVTFPSASSRSVLVSPVLSYQAQIFSAASLPASVHDIINFGMITDSSALPSGSESNKTDNPLTEPQLVLIKSNSPAGTVSPGDVITYNLIVSNEGTGNATGVVVSDTVPTNTTYVPGSASPPPASGPNPLVFNLGTLEAGASTTITFQATTNTGLAAGTYTISNSFTATASNITGTLTSNTVSNTLNVVASFGVTKIPNMDAVSKAGDIITYTISVINNGDVALTGISINDPLLGSLTGPSGDTNSNGQLDIIETWTYTGTYTVQQTDIDTNGGGDGQIDNTVTVDFDETTPQTASASVPIVILEVTKTADPLVMAAPGIVTYYYTVTNNGSLTLNPVTLSDDKAGSVTLGSASLAPGASTTGTATYTVTQAMIDAGTPIVNTATATGTIPLGHDVTATATATVFITHEPYPQIQMVKTGTYVDFNSDGKQNAGDKITYTFKVTNTGNVALTNVTVTDPKVTVSGGPLGSLAPGASDSSTFTGSYILTQADIDAGTFINTATATGTYNSTPYTGQDSDTQNFTQSPSITLDKLGTYVDFNGNGKQDAGDKINYSFTVTNTGTVTLSNVTVTDPVITVNGGPTAHLAPGATDSTTFTGSYTLTQSDIAAGTFTNTATATGMPPIGSNVTATNSDTQTFVITDLAITKSDSPDPVTVGNDLTYNLTATNYGPSDATGVVVTDTLPSGVTFKSANTHGTGNVSALGGVVTWSGFGLVKNNSATIDIVVTVNPPVSDGTVISNTAQVTGNQTDTVPTNNTASQGTTVNAPTLTATKVYSLFIDRDQDNAPCPGDTLKYTIAVTNSGNGLAKNVTFTDHPDSKTSLVPGSVDITLCPGATVTSGNNPGDTFVGVHIGDLSPAATVQISFQVVIWTDRPTTVANQGTISGANFSSVPTDDPATPEVGDPTLTEIAVEDPLLNITKQGPTEAVVDSNITYTGIISNNSDATAYNVVLVDQLPAGVTFLSSSHNATYNLSSNTVTWNLPDLSFWDSSAGWLSVHVAGDIADGTVLTDVFSLTWKDYLGNSFGPATASWNTTAYSHPQLTLDKSGPSEASPGQFINYNLTMHNQSGIAAQNVTLTDTLPAGVAYISSNPGGTYNLTDQTVTWNLGTINSYGSENISVMVQVNSGLGNDTTLTNHASVTWNDALGGNFGPITGSWDTIVYTQPELQITKRGPAEAVVDSNITYTGTLTNVGGSTASNVVLTDILPSGVTFISSSHSATYNLSSNTVTWNLPDLPPGASIPGWLNVHISGGIANSTVLTDVFRVTWNYSGEPLGPATASWNTTAYTHPQLTLDKSGPVEAYPNESLTYTINISNLGDSDAINAVIVDDLPNGLTYDSSNPSGTLVGGMIMWGPMTVPAHGTVGITLTVTVDGDVQNNTVLMDTAMVNWRDSLGGNYGPVSDAARTTVYTQPHLTISKSGPPKTYPGVTFNYTISVCNTGGSNAQDVVLTDFLPVNLTYSSSNYSGTYNETDRTVTWNLSDLDHGECLSDIALTVLVDTDVPNGILLENIGDVSWKDGDGNQYGPVSAIWETLVNTAPYLTVDKTGPAEARQGDQITYNLTVCNTGGSDAENVILLTDILPDGLSYVSSNHSGNYDPVGHTVSWNLSTIPAGTCVTDISVTLNVDFDVSPGSSLVDTAIITWQDADNNNYGPSTDTATTRVDAALSLTKTASAASVYPGGTVTFNLTYSNLGTTTLTNVILTDVYDSNMVFVSADPPPSTGNGTWAIGNLISGGSGNITVTVQVALDAQPGTTMINQAQITSDQKAEANAHTNTTVAQPPDLAVTKSDYPDPVFAGQNLTYNLTVTNNGPADATGVEVIDTLDPRVSFISASDDGIFDSGQVTWNLSSMTSGATWNLTLVVIVNSSTTGKLTNTVTVASNEYDLNSSNNTYREETTVNTRSDLAITKIGDPDTVIAGTGPLTYNLTVTNNGPSDATGVTVNDNIPAQTTFISWNATQGTYSVSTYNWTVGNLVKGESAILTLVVGVNEDAIDTISNTATVSGIQTDPDTGNNTATRDTTVNTRTDLAISKIDSPDPVIAGQNLTYNLTVTNNGPSTAMGVTVNDAIPVQTTYISYSATQGTYSTSTYNWTVGSLANGASATLTLVVAVSGSATSPLSNTATVSGGLNDPDTDNNMATQNTTVSTQTDLAITKIDSPDPVTAGNDVTYTVTVTNNGPSDATDVVVTDILPSGVTFKSAAPSQGSYNSGNGIWSVGSLTAGSGATLTLVATVNSSTPGTISNAATVSGGLNDPDTGNNTATQDTTVNAQTDLAITKTDNPDPVVAGTDLTYNLTVKNNGPSDATGVMVNDTIPAQTTFSSWNATLGTYSSSTYNWTVGSLAVGESATLNLVVAVSEDATNIISNTATVSGGLNDPDMDNNTATRDTFVNTQTDLAITKTDSPDPVIAGQNLTYNLTVTNNGPSAATAVTVIDNIPDQTTYFSWNATKGIYSAPTWTVDSLANGESATLTFVVTVSEDAEDTINNTATVSGLQTDSDMDNNTVTQLTSVANITLDKTASPTTYNEVDDAITYSYNLTNSGNITLDAPFTATDDKATVTFPVTPTSLAPGESITGTATYNITQTDLDAGSVTNTATAHVTYNATTIDSNPDSETVTASQNPAIDVTKAADPTTYNAVAQVITYTVSVKNTGNVTFNLTDTDVTDPRITLTYQTGDDGNKKLDVGETWNYTGTHSITQDDLDAGSFTNTASATAYFGSTPYTESDDETVTATQTPAMTVSKVAAESSVNAAGDIIHYTITVKNTGNVTLTKVTPTDPLLGSLSGPTGDTNSNGKLDISETWNYTGTYAVLQSDIDNNGKPNPDSKINNMVSVVTFETSTSVTASAEVPLTQSPAIKVEKSSTITSITHTGQVVTYNFTVTNVGNMTLTGITVTDPGLDAAAILLSGDTNIDGRLQTSETWNYSGSHTVTQAEMDAGGRLQNIVTADSNQSAPDADSHNISITQSPHLSLTKTASPTAYSAVGQVISYTVSVKNTGNVTLNLTDTDVTDPQVMLTYQTGDTNSNKKLDVGETWNYTGTHTINQADLDAGSFTNTASAKAYFGTTPYTGSADKTVTTGGGGVGGEVTAVNKIALLKSIFASNPLSGGAPNWLWSGVPLFLIIGVGILALRRRRMP